MNALLVLGFRNIWRNRRRTLISMSAIGVGLVLVTLYSGLVAGMLGDAKNQLDNIGLGHVEISAQGWRGRRVAAAVVQAPQALLSSLELPLRSEVGHRVLSRGLATSARGSQGVEVLGVDWDNEASLSMALRDVRQGELPKGDDDGVLIGERLAERLKVGLGAKLRLMVQRADGEVSADLFRVRGLFHSVSATQSSRQVYVSTAAARTLLGLGDASHQLVIQLDRAAEADAVAAGLRQKLGPGYEVASYGQLLPTLKMMEELTDAVIIGAALFIYLLVGLGVMNTMLMSVLERTREFGVLLAIGTRPRRLVAMVVAEAFWIATLSVAVGLGVGLLLNWYGSQHALIDMSAAGESFEMGGAAISSAIHTRFHPADGFKAAAFVYVMALVVGLYPAWRVSRLHPAHALHRA